MRVDGFFFGIRQLFWFIESEMVRKILRNDYRKRFQIIVIICNLRFIDFQLSAQYNGKKREVRI